MAEFAGIKIRREGFGVNMYSLDPEQVVVGGRSSENPGYWLHVPEADLVLTPHTAYLLHRALTEYLAGLERAGQTPVFWIESKGLPEDVGCYSITN
jgi:hypothetical protein